MRAWLRRLFCPPEHDLLKQRSDQIAAKSEEVMRESKNTLSVLRQVREVEQIAKDRP